MFLKLSGKFPLGKMVMSATVCEAIADDLHFSKFVMDSLKRHALCDWGEIPKEDIGQNENALRFGDRIFSVYGYDGFDSLSNKIWIITEADRSATTVLFPEDY